jgi:hypothetical protein
MNTENHFRIWKEMSHEEKVTLWRENCNRDWFSSGWSFSVFSTSTSAICRALQKREISND